MAVIVKSIAAAATKWVARAQTAVEDYTDGVAGTQKDQAALAEAAEPTSAAGVATAAQNDALARGVARAGPAGWKAGVGRQGARRFGTGGGRSHGRATPRVG